MGYKCSLFKNKNFSKKVKTIIYNHKFDLITKITIGRYALPNILMTSINVLSLNQMNQRMKSQKINKLYHVFLIIETASNENFLLEKNETINLVKNPLITNKNEYYPIAIIPVNLTMEVLLNNTKIFMGKYNFFNYDACENDCQDFTISCLMSNKMCDVKYDAFIKQNTEPLFNGSLKNSCEVAIDIAVIKNKVEDAFDII